MRGTIILIALLASAPLALAQDSEPTVNDSDYDTAPPAGDESYLDDAEAEYSEEPSVSDADFDTSLPADDQSYLTDAEADAGSGADVGSGEGAGTDTPGIALVLMLAVVGAVALFRRR